MAVVLALLVIQPVGAQSVVRLWNQQVLDAISRDFARPPIHARNLFTVSAAMYDAWSAYAPDHEPYLLGRQKGVYICPFNGVAIPQDPVELKAAREEAISHAAYRLIVHRFQNSPGVLTTLTEIDALMDSLGYDAANTSLDYVNGGPAELGNYVANEYIAFGFTDDCNEEGNYADLHYTPINPPIAVEFPGNPDMVHPNNWQSISLSFALDQAGNPVVGTPAAIGHNWGRVLPFALDSADLTMYERDGFPYPVYHDPGAPTLLDTTDASGMDSFWKWNFLLVSIWQAHLDPADETIWDISPASIGNIPTYPASQDFEAYLDFYDLIEGGAPSPGHPVNPATGMPYEPQLVKRGDYARILAEYWADGPNSVTPPGHWFKIMHDVLDHPLFQRRWMGTGDVLDDLEYDAKAHMVIGGALHDAAISAWGIKGWYDYVRPVSAIRYMAERGQCHDPDLPNYHPAGLPVVPGYVEMVMEGDTLAGPDNEHVGKMKLFTWRGPEYIEDPETDVAGVGWVLAEEWWPYQRPWFVSPPFAGYVSGHSTYSSAAAQVLELITGDRYFPGGMRTVVCPQNEFLVFEEGPSQDVVLQWATYRDASDQCSLSRIWGGIHPPMDDIAGRHIGIELGNDAVELANELFNTDRPVVVSITVSDPLLNIDDIGSTFSVTITYDKPMDQSVEPAIQFLVQDPLQSAASPVTSAWIDENSFVMIFELLPSELRMYDIFMRVDNGLALNGLDQDVYLSARPFSIDTDRPTVVSITPSYALVNDAVTASGTLTLDILIDERCDTDLVPSLFWTGGNPAATLQYDPGNSQWMSPTLYRATFAMADANEEIADLGIIVNGLTDQAGNAGEDQLLENILSIDTRNPIILALDLNDDVLNQQNAGGLALVATIDFDEPMVASSGATFDFPDDDPVGSALFLNPGSTLWTSSTTYQRAYNLLVTNEEFFNITVDLVGFSDLAGNDPAVTSFPQLFTIDTRRPTVTLAVPAQSVVADANVGAGGFHVDIVYDEPMNIAQVPLVQLTGASDLAASLDDSPTLSSWVDPLTFRVVFNVADEDREVDAIGLSVSFAQDASGNSQDAFSGPDLFQLDTRNPEVLLFTANTYQVGDAQIGEGGLTFAAVFDEAMDQSTMPSVSFNADGDVGAVLNLNEVLSQWLNSATHRSVFDVANAPTDLGSVDVLLADARDEAGNPVTVSQYPAFLNINIGGVGLEELAVLFDLGIHPNPLITGRSPVLTLGAALQRTDLWVFDGKGTLVHQRHLGDLAAGNHALDLPALAPGIYTLRFLADGVDMAIRLQAMEP